MPRLIALAQRRQRWLLRIGGARPLGELPRVYVLALPGKDEGGLYFYTALFPAAFLDRLTRPSEHIACGPVTIKRRRIPFAPTEEFMRGIGKALSLVRKEPQ